MATRAGEQLTSYERIFSRAAAETPATSETPAVTADPRPDESTSGRATVLVVDDEEMVRRLAARILLTLGYHVLEARSGQEAVRLLRRGAHRINGVLTDVAMPGIGGRELGETIARCWPQIRVLYMSGFAAMRMVNQGDLDPNQPFIQKPFTSEQLGRRMRELLAYEIEQ
jgi:two-component system, cell cycle sensor histidine kinase and response regulator CckA